MMTEVDVYAMWVNKAEGDLKAVRMLLGARDAAFYDAACFHAQQCAEKYIKGFLSRRGVKFPKAHDLGELIGLMPEPQRPAVVMAEIESLSGYAVIPRYPGFGEELNESDAVEAVRIAEKVKEAVLEKLR